MRKWNIAIYFALTSVVVVSLYAPYANAQMPDQIIPVWPGIATGSENWTQKEGSLDLEDSRFSPANPDTLVWNVVKPTLALFKPSHARGDSAAVIIAPGGGFRVLSYKNEGLRVARWLADRGVTAFVLKYRLHTMPDDPAEVRKQLDAMMAAASRLGSAPSGTPPGNGVPAMEIGTVERLAISDGQQAIDLVRSRAKEFGIDPQRIGFIGFSAGGVVAGGATVSADAADRPNFVSLIYSFLPGEIPAHMPPAFFAAAADDPLSNGLPELFSRWRASGSSAELHIYAKGQHGFGTAKQNLPVDHWLDSYYGWMDQQGFLKQK